MEIKGKRVMVLGGYGEVGSAICRKLLQENPRQVIVTSLAKEEALDAVRKLGPEASGKTRLTPVHGNLFVRWSLKDTPRDKLQSTPEYQRWLAEDALEELNEKILTSSTLFKIIARHQPEIIIDCINTATALAYQNIYQSYKEVSRALKTPKDVSGLTISIYHLLSTVCIPPLIRHIQILLEAMKRKGTLLYLKVGTTGTGGMGLNIPFTHGEEQPSRLLLSKAAVAGAHTLLLFLLSRTPGGPIAKELKPAALIGWKGVGRGRVVKGGSSIPLYDCPPGKGYRLVPGKRFFGQEAKMGKSLKGKEMEGAYVDTGENGLFSLDEYKVVTALGLMEYITPEEIAREAILEIKGTHSSKDVLGAIAGAVMGSTYRAGVLRQRALKEMEGLAGDGFAYGLLGPRVAKLIFEAHLLRRQFGTLEKVVGFSPSEISRFLEKEVAKNGKMRSAALSLGIPILLSDGETLLFATRSRPDKTWEEEPVIITKQTIDRWASQEWIDLRPQNMSRWVSRFQKILKNSALSARDTSSRFDRGNRFWPRDSKGQIAIDPGEMVGWILVEESAGS